jgi:hypothetical protein
MFADNLKENYLTYPGDIRKVIDHLKECPTYNTNKKIEYFNIPAAFDIETTSFFENAAGEVISTVQWAKLSGKDKSNWTKKAIMYIWQIGFNGFCIVGRTWEDFEKLMDEISTVLNLGEDKRIIIYVHNLSFEFNFIKSVLSGVQSSPQNHICPYMLPLQTVLNFDVLTGTQIKNWKKLEKTCLSIR